MERERGELFVTKEKDCVKGKWTDQKHYTERERMRREREREERKRERE